MKKLVFILIVLPLLSIAQPTVYNQLTNQITYSKNLINSGSNAIICYSGFSNNGFKMAFVDSFGVIYNQMGHGTDSTDVLRLAKKIETSNVLFCGHSFFYDTSQLGVYKAYVTITDTLGNFQMDFPLFRNTTYFNSAYNGLFLDGYYYFVGEEYDVVQNNNTLMNLFCCKTDTFGNILWYQSFPQYNTEVGWKIGFEYSYDKTRLLVGATILDSLVNGNEYYSYFLMSIDTSGNNSNRILLPEFSNNIGITGLTEINHIGRIFTNKYIIAGRREYYILDSQFIILDSINLMSGQYYSGYFAYKNLYDDSYIVGGYESFGKNFNGNALFTKNFSTEPAIISLQDVIPTYDGGYLALIHNSGSTRYIKMDCEGNYVNPITCWPTSTGELANIDFQIKYHNHHFSFNNKSEYVMEAKLFDMQGRALQQFDIQKGMSSNGIGNYASGIYFIAITHEGMLLKTEKILVE